MKIFLKEPIQIDVSAIAKCLPNFYYRGPIVSINETSEDISDYKSIEKSTVLLFDGKTDKGFTKIVTDYNEIELSALLAKLDKTLADKLTDALTKSGVKLIVPNSDSESIQNTKAEETLEKKIHRKDSLSITEMSFLEEKNNLINKNINQKQNHLTVIISSFGSDLNTKGTYKHLKAKFGNQNNVLFIGDGDHKLDLSDVNGKLNGVSKNYESITFIFNTHGENKDGIYIIPDEDITYQKLVNTIDDATKGINKDLFHIGCYGGNIFKITHEFDAIVALSDKDEAMINYDQFDIGSSNALQLFDMYLNSPCTRVNSYIVEVGAEKKQVRINEVGLPYFGGNPRQTTPCGNFHQECKTFFKEFLDRSATLGYKK